MAPEIDRIIIQQPDGTRQSFALTGAKITIGRNPENTLHLDHHLVSRYHAELHVDPQGLVITDLGSANGTFVGSDRLLRDQPRLLAPGMEVHIGPFTLIFQPAEQPVDPADQSTGPVEPPTDPVDQSTAVIETTTGVIETIGVIETAIVPPPVAPPSLSYEIARRSSSVVAHAPRLPSRDQRSRYIEHLPIIFQDSDLLNRYLLIFESLWEPLEQREDYVEMYFDPRTCPATFLPWLAGWLGVSLNPHWPEVRCRQLLAEALDLYHWRGTRYGLTRMIKVCTGLTPEIEEDPAQPFFFSVRIPKTADEIDWDLIEELIIAHKPAHAGYVLERWA